MTKEINTEFIEKEYFSIQESINKYDEHILKIKSWSVTLSLAGIVTGFVKSAEHVFIISSVASILFWILDCIWKSFQQAFYHRAYKIENYMAGKMEKELSSKFSSPDILGAWSAGWKSTKWIKLFFSIHILLPHLPITIVGLVLWIFFNFYEKL